MKITEDYVSYEVAKLLKEKGFNVSTHAFYNPKKSYILKFDPCLIDRNAGIYVSAPTHQMAMRWLREEYDLYIIAFPYKANDKKKWCCQVYKTFNLLGYEKYVNETLDSYEEAVEAALKYTLENLIL